MKRIIAILITLLIARAYMLGIEQGKQEGFQTGWYYGIQHVINDSTIYTTERYNPDDPEASEWNGYNQRILIVVDDITYEVGMHQC